MDFTTLVQLPHFEGPLELLLYLIKKEEIDIYDIPISHITHKYLEVLGHYEDLNLDVGGEFLVMASTLMYIKSRMLLPQDNTEEESEENTDPRSELVRQLREFQMFQEASQSLKSRDILGVDTFHNVLMPEKQLVVDLPKGRLLAPISLFELIKKFKASIDHAQRKYHYIEAEEIPLRKCIEQVVERLEETQVLHFSEIVANRWSLRELIVFFLAILELARMNFLKVVQEDNCGAIRLERNPDMQELDMSQLSWI